MDISQNHSGATSPPTAADVFVATTDHVVIVPRADRLISQLIAEWVVRDAPTTARAIVQADPTIPVGATAAPQRDCNSSNPFDAGRQQRRAKTPEPIKLLPLVR